MNNFSNKAPVSTSIDIDSLVDINSVEIDLSLSVPQKQQSFLKQIKNPYLFRCDDTTVRLSFGNSDLSLADMLKEYFLSRQGLSLSS
ncbi:MAG: hypothetical protein FWB87_11015 [Defluviitaleaceae bacterium]|nr:hypothetical protein [Defluviitaleaceae bacterium]MCL2261942.1 hypothetical protein [Defluviitaleaceae bacterium]